MFEENKVFLFRRDGAYQRGNDEFLCDILRGEWSNYDSAISFRFNDEEARDDLEELAQIYIIFPAESTDNQKSDE